MSGEKTVNIEETPTPQETGAKPHLIQVPFHVDDRGPLCQVLGSYSEDFPAVKRAYVVSNFAKGTIRGFHMHKGESKAYYVLQGAAKFVVVSEDFQRTNVEVLTEQDNRILIVPPTLYHGWISLSEKAAVIGFSDRTLEESEGDDFRVDPLKLGAHVWEVKPR